MRESQRLPAVTKCNVLLRFVERSRAQLLAANALSDSIKLNGAAVRPARTVFWFRSASIVKQISFFCICVALTLRLLHQVSRMFGEDEFSGNPMDLCMQVLQFADNLERAYGELKSDGAIIPPDAVERMRQAEKECEKSPRK